MGQLPLKLRNLLGGLAVTGAVLACARIDIPLGVTVRAPNDGASLAVGESFRVLADSDIEQAPNQGTLFEIHLWDPASRYAMTWQVEVLSNAGSRVMDESFLVPPDAPPGSDYRLTVSALPGGGSDNPPFSFADTIRVRVVASP